MGVKIGVGGRCHHDPPPRRGAGGMTKSLLVEMVNLHALLLDFVDMAEQQPELWGQLEQRYRETSGKSYLLLNLLKCNLGLLP